jgi:hypothetical protein
MSTPKVLFSKLWRKQKGNCYLCGNGMSRQKGKANTATFDHVMPKSILKLCTDGYLAGNKKLACKSCNAEKADKPVREFMREKGYLNDFKTL